MENPPQYISVMALYFIGISLIFCAHATDSPKYALLHSGSDYEIRLYRDILWLSALVQGTSFHKSTNDGFHRIYQYIHGANLNSSQFPITAPVITSITPSSQHGTEYYVKMFLSTNSSATPPPPNPELNLQLQKWKSQYLAVRKFSGFAKDDNIIKEAEALVTSLDGQYFNGSSTVLADENSYSIAQYNASRQLWGRVNEVWMNISGLNRVQRNVYFIQGTN